MTLLFSSGRACIRLPGAVAPGKVHVMRPPSRRRRGGRLHRMLWKALHHLPEMELRLRTRHGPLRVSNKDRGVGRILFLHGEYEHGGIQKAVRLLRQVRSRWPQDGGLIIDAGANIGTVCISMVKNHLFSGALAIEPEPRNYRLLARNVADNGLAGAIRCSELALS